MPLEAIVSGGRLSEISMNIIMITAKINTPAVNETLDGLFQIILEIRI